MIPDVFILFWLYFSINIITKTGLWYSILWVFIYMDPFANVFIHKIIRYFVSKELSSHSYWIQTCITQSIFPCEIIWTIYLVRLTKTSYNPNSTRVAVWPVRLSRQGQWIKKFKPFFFIALVMELQYIRSLYT